MRIGTILFSLLFFISPLHGQKKQDEILKKGRITKVINSGWTFNYFASDAAGTGQESPGFNDSRWPSISLPHTWNSYETTRELKPFTKSPAETGEIFWWTGSGWYRKHFSINSDLSDHKVFIEFKGVQKYCKVWINGKYAGDHKGGYGSFDFDITGFINPGADNLIAVEVNFLQKDEFRMHPLTDGSFNVSCGIYRDVTIVLKNKLFIPMQGSATHEGGTFITTPVVSDKEGIVRIKTWVKNEYPQSRNCILQSSITDRANQVIQVIKTEAVINAGEYYMFDQISKPVKNPHLWSVEDPCLYTVHSEVIDKKEVLDDNSCSFGFRWYKTDVYDSSVYLNDKRIEPDGVNRHQQYPWLGDAIPSWLVEMDYSDISGKTGKNFVRTINYPGDEVSYDQADKHGIITEEDFSGIRGHGFSPDDLKQQIVEMIRRDRNHPAIISWSIGDDPGNMVNKTIAAAEDSTREIKSVPARIDTSSAYFIYHNKRHPPDLQREVAGEPAKILVNCSHERIEADKGAVAIIIASITDSNGNPVPGARNTIQWKISGPGKLVGPAYYISHADSSCKPEDGWYMEMPATNVIRSTGLPGKIRITVFSSGLASGSVEIDAEERKSDNSIINEPALSDAGRKPVVGKSLVTERLEEIPQEIVSASEDFKLTAADKNGFARLMRDYIKNSNPSIDSMTIEFKTLTALLAAQLFNNGGILSAADYNFNIKHYNTSRLISGYIAATKLPQIFKEFMRKYYSKIIISQGSEKNAGDEMNWLNWIPSGGIIVVVRDQTTDTGQKGIIFTNQTELPEIIKVVYPQFANFSAYAKERAFVFISKMNPNIQVRHVTGNSTGESQKESAAVTYSVEKGVPVLIPEYKFISE